MTATLSRDNTLIADVDCLAAPSRQAISGTRGRRLRTAVGALLLSAAMCSAGLLAIKEIFDIPLPGCALFGACEHSFGTARPLLGVWPIAFLGTAYFAGVLVAWLRAGGLGRALTWIVRSGVLASVAMVVIMALSRNLCLYCLIVHSAHLAFGILMEVHNRCGIVQHGPALGLVGFAIVLVSLTSINRWTWDVRLEQEARDWNASVDSIASSTSSGATPPLQQKSGRRYRYGAPDASLELVVFSNYRCSACSLLDEQLFALAGERADLAIEIVHATFCPAEAETHARADSLSPCQLARAAVAAGIAGGAEAYWRMHRWLMQQKGLVTWNQLDGALITCGLAGERQKQFHIAMAGKESLTRVVSDADDAVAIGIRETPTVFVNGVELRGWRRIGIRQSIESIAERRGADASVLGAVPPNRPANKRETGNNP